MATRRDRGFRFPLQKYSDEKALYTNFRYLQEYLNYIRKHDRSAATVIVAASDSKTPEQAHYQAGATNSSTQIQAAVDDLPAAGGKIVLLEGTYDMNASINLGSKNVTIEGAGLPTLNLTGSGFTGSGDNFYSNLRFTGGGGGGTACIASNGGERQLSVENCRFEDLSVQACIQPTQSGPGLEGWVYIVGNKFIDVALSGGGGFTSQAVIYKDGGGDTRQWVVMGNLFHGITYGHSQGKVISADGDDTEILVIGNSMNNVGGSTKYGDGSRAHNILDGAYVAGDHTGLTLDHGTGLTGLGDDDHPHYLKEKASGGLASEVPEHDHSSAAEAGELDIDQLTDIMLLGGM